MLSASKNCLTKLLHTSAQLGPIVIPQLTFFEIDESPNVPIPKSLAVSSVLSPSLVLSAKCDIGYKNDAFHLWRNTQ